jgi:Copper binding proteins, plastocyanin/azurin family
MKTAEVLDGVAFAAIFVAIALAGPCGPLVRFGRRTNERGVAACAARPIRTQRRSGRDDGSHRGQKLQVRPASDRSKRGIGGHLDERGRLPAQRSSPRRSDATHDLPIGDSVRFTFDEAGDYHYECSIHPQQMRGKVVVTN